VKLFRPPYGVTNPMLSRAIKKMRYQSIGWSLKSDDTVIKDESELLNNVLSKVRNGDIILFHDNKPLNVKTLDKLIGHLQEKGFVLYRLDEFLNIQSYV
jgi:peptidoglycan/xylan/chitin deacetylase (PgdA/CDA1 family)